VLCPGAQGFKHIALVIHAVENEGDQANADGELEQVEEFLFHG